MLVDTTFRGLGCRMVFTFEGGLEGKKGKGREEKGQMRK